MRKKILLALAAALPLVAAGCNSFLSGDKLSNNPNRPTVASEYELFVGSEVDVMQLWETYPMNLLPLWAEQIAGVQRQWKDFSQFRSGTDQFAADGLWNTTYGQGGINDLLRVDSGATAINNVQLRGQSEVLRALLGGTAADLWGDVPFSKAGGSSASHVNQPTFDAQADVYAHVVALLDSAIADLSAPLPAGGGGVDAGCSEECDFFYANDMSLWVAAAHTLKARWLMHQTRVGDPTSLLNQVVTEAQQGISSPAGDMQTNHTTTFGEQNLFYQFLVGPRAGDVEPSQVHMDVLTQTGNQALLPFFYVKGTGASTFIGSLPGQTGGTQVASFNIGPTTPQGIVTYTENQMLLAEAQYRLGSPGNALATLNAYRASVGTGPEPGSPSGAQILVDILLEKFARDFLNPEVYFDYLRTCVPNIPLPAQRSSAFPYVPARLPYGYTETISNPNVPSSQPLANAAWPKNLTDPLGNPCLGQKDRPGT